MSASEATLVTGGSSGIGAAIVASRLARGERVVNLDLKTPENESKQQALDTRLVDLSDVEALRAALDDIARDYAVTRLVNCAGIAVRTSLEQTAVVDIDRIMAVNVTAPTLIAQAVVPAMIAAGFGRIVNISSRTALGKTLRTAYAASKGGLISATRVWALELGAHGITVNAIGPGPIETELYRRVNPPDSPETQAIVRGVPVKRLGRPQDIAHAVDFFLAKEAGFVTGQTLYVCGGLTIGNAQF